MKIDWIPIDKLRPNPKNRNKHTDEQIERLAAIIKYQGWRWPIIADKDNTIWAGHGRWMAAAKLELKEVPVSYQEFTSEDQAYAFLVSDNAISAWAELDLGGINADLEDLGPDFDLDLLGLRKFMLEPADKFNPEDEWQDMPEFNQEDQMAHHSIKVNFATDHHVQEFARLIGQSLTMKTKSIWHPEAIEKDTKNREYE